MWIKSSVLFGLFTLVFGMLASPAAGEVSEDTPVIVLNHTTGNFFVLASDLPFRVGKAARRVSWFAVEAVEGSETLPRTIEVTSRPARLRRRNYASAIRIDISTPTGEDYLLIPVVLRVGSEHKDRFGLDKALFSSIPARYSRLKPRDPNIDVRVKSTPGGHFIVEILDGNNRGLEINALSATLSDIPPRTTATQGYPAVFPWMCLENPCGRSTDADIQDVAPNLDSVNAVSYERYSMTGGSWRILSGIGDPGDWAHASGLRTWPMAVGGYQPTEAQINAMWAGREVIAQGMVEAALSRGYEGFCVDVEGHARGNSKNTFINLVTYLANRLHDNGIKLMVAHATWATLAPIDDLASSPVDYVATMDPYTSAWRTYIPNVYQSIEASRLVWGFTWDRVTGSTQNTMWQWMEANGYNQGVAGAAAWRTPLMASPNGINYYEGFRRYYPTAVEPPPGDCIASVVPQHWKGEYFSSIDLTGSPTMVRDDGNGALSFDWATGSPSADCGVPQDRFSVRWTRDVSFVAGTYRFTVTSDDGLRLYVDGSLKLDEWFDQGPTTYTVDVSLTAGEQPVRLEYYENGGGATVALSWERVGGPPSTDPIVIDDGDPGFELLETSTGRTEWWHPETGVGYGNDMVWTTNTYSRKDNYARWQPTLPQAGDYKIEVYIPSNHATTRQARYEVHAQGAAETVVANQNGYSNQWVELGTFSFSGSNNGSEYVELGDVTGETSNSLRVGFDAMRFTLEGGGPPSDCIASVVPERWKGEYFSSIDLSGSPTMVRDDGDGALSFDWGAGSPSTDCGVPQDAFSVRWTRNVAFAAGTHRFTVTSDDGFRLYVDGSLKLDEWFDQGPTTYTVDVALTAGEHPVRLEYYENGGGATAALSWQTIATGPIVIDDGDPGFELLETSTGRTEWWHPETGVGYGNDMVWTTNTYSRKDNYARWKPTLPQAGDYKIEVYIPSNHATTRQARYEVHAQGAAETVVVNQNSYSNQWVELGTFSFSGSNNGSEYVELGDVTGETSNSLRVGFDAMRFTLEGGGPPSDCIASVVPERWKGEYFSSIDLSGSPTMVRDDGDGALSFDWGAGSPSTDCGVPQDAFSVRWTRTVSFAAGTYRFTVTSDDGFRLYVDGSLKLDEWFDQGPTTYTVDVALTAGGHPVRLEYYENGGGATAALSWQAIATGPIVIDDGDQGFELLETSTGRTEWWHPETGVGYGNDMVWTMNTYSRKDNYARWTPNLPSGGYYTIEVYVPSNHATTRQARYTIRASGATHSRTINQNIYSDQWVDIGTFSFNGANNGTEYVELGDVTGETSNSLEVGFDAIRFTPSSAPPPTSGGWAFPVGSADSMAGWTMTNGLGNSWSSYLGHLGEDYAKTGGGSLGQPVYAAAAGEVITVLQNCGNYVDVVIIEHQVDGISEPIYSFYGHIEANGYVQVGDRVSRRQQIGVLGNPVTFSPHLHFEIKNHTALVNRPFSSCSNTAQGIYISAGYSGIRNDYNGGDYYDPSNDGVVGNRYYHPTRFIQNRLNASTTRLYPTGLRIAQP